MLTITRGTAPAVLPSRPLPSLPSLTSYAYFALSLSPQEALPVLSLLSRPSQSQPKEVRQAGLEQGTEQMAWVQARELPGLAQELGIRCFQTPMMLPSPLSSATKEHVHVGAVNRTVKTEPWLSGCRLI